MHIEVQVALNFVISYLYNKLPRRRVNIFGEELEKALKAKFQGHWYPEKPFKGSAFRCLKTGDPTDAVLDRAARESGVPISDILEILPAELAVWVDPGEVSYRIGEKGAVKILFSESSDHHAEDTTSADREVTKTFNPEAQCFRPIDAVNSSMSVLSLSPKSSPHSSPPTSAPSPASAANSNSGNYIKNPNSPPGNAAVSTANTNGTGGTGGTTSIGNSFLTRTQAPLTFTTATFAQTKFGSTKLKTNSKRSNSRMSPTEFSNYIKQRAMQQQLHHSHNGHAVGNTNGHLGPIGPISPARSLSPNPLSVAIMNGATTNGSQLSSSNGLPNNSYFFPNSSNGSNINTNMYSPQQYGRNNLFDSNSVINTPSNHYSSAGPTNGVYTNNYGGIGNGGKYSPYLDANNFYGMSHQQPQPSNNISSIGHSLNSLSSNGHQQGLHASLTGTNIGNGIIGSGLSNGISGNNSASLIAPIGSPGHMNSQDGNAPSNSSGSNLLDSMSSFYSNPGPYQHLLVAN